VQPDVFDLLAGYSWGVPTGAADNESGIGATGIDGQSNHARNAARQSTAES